MARVAANAAFTTQHQPNISKIQNLGDQTSTFTTITSKDAIT